MNIDIFLNSKSDWAEINEKTIIKVKYNENLDFLYIPFFGWDFYDGSKLSFIGVYDRKHNELYGDEYYLNSKDFSDLKSETYRGNMEQIEYNLIDKLNILIENYIIENENKLLDLSQNKFLKYVSNEECYSTLKQEVTKKYIYGERFKNIKFPKIIRSFRIDDTKLKLDCLNDIEKTATDIFEKYINSKEEIYMEYRSNDFTIKGTNKEKLSFDLLVHRLKENLLKEMELNPTKEQKKKHDIIKCIKNLDAQMLTITIKHDDKVLSFKYPKRNVWNLDYNEDKIPDLDVREQVEELYKYADGRKDNVFINDIVKIEYSRKTLYEDNELLNSNKKETHDIVDDMFD